MKRPKAAWFKTALTLFVAWLAIAGGSPRLVSAEVPASQPAPYPELIDRAVAAFERGDYEEARADFARAHALAPSARTLRGLGKAEFESMSRS